ncbi:hypothetical protein [Amycolatopsis acidicola]|uniref:hypothetical protein n=1 Tax=Amycolatopsis acidicola TaxID=2596893 RepID=UPI001FB6A675|nr:hypothetical protein [Amycolatopsis acidicola]
MANVWRKLLNVPEARWADPIELARPATGRGAPKAFQAITRALGRIPGVSTPRCSGPLAGGVDRVSG